MAFTSVNLLGFLSNIGWPEVVIILIAVLLLFGGKKLPELARGLAKGLKAFKKEMREIKDEISDSTEDNPKPDDTSRKSDAPRDDSGPYGDS